MKDHTLKVLVAFLFVILSAADSTCSGTQTPVHELSGEIEILISDDFKKGISNKEYWLIHGASEHRTKLEFKKMPTQLETGDRIKVMGHGTEKLFLVEEYQRK